MARAGAAGALLADAVASRPIAGEPHHLLEERPMQSVTTAPSSRVRLSPVMIIAIALAALVAVPITWFLVDAVRGPTYIDRIVISNPNDFDVNVRVSGGEGDGQVVLGPVAADSTDTSRSVVDQGDEWVFHFDRAGESIGDLTFARRQLEADDWRVEAPTGREGG
jgi:hypothetical protein